MRSEEWRCAASNKNGASFGNHHPFAVGSHPLQGRGLFKEVVLSDLCAIPEPFPCFLRFAGLSLIIEEIFSEGELCNGGKR